MNHLIIIAHPRRDSLNYQLTESIREALEETGSQVKVRDLYAMNFNPVLTIHELKYLKEGKICPDILVEQSYIEWADELTVIFPLWWNAFPAILKGYIDRVFTNGFAFKVTPRGVEGMLKGKRVRLITSAGMDESSLKENHIMESLRYTQDLGVFEFCGMKTIDHLYITESTRLSPEQKEKVIRRIMDQVITHSSPIAKGAGN
ncbi:MAG: NAD(P)H-dependent oxidoreductase [Bacteroidales bacterium]|jgi:NAD(P)H dehydrogenase (quinone)|nr:NAD(P)H-dependent oxidoreductase [Bacteroidales bacterium]